SVLGLLAARLPAAGAQDASRAEAGSQALQTWEEVLLLEAVRYLDLTPAQLQRMAAVAEGTYAPLTRLQAEGNRTLAALGPVAQKQRDALVAGRIPPAQEQKQAMALSEELRRRRARTEEEIVGIALPRLFSFLKPEQLQRIYLLVHGDVPLNVTRSPLL